MATTHHALDQPSQRLQNELAAAEMELRDARWDDVRRWYVDGQGQTLVVIPNPADYGDNRIDHSFAIACHELTVAEYLRFRPQRSFNRTFAPSDDCPAHQITWYEAAEYCNWLSQQEGIPEDQWVYYPNADGQYADGMTIKEDYLRLSGYRLPTEGEWEYACRAGTTGTYALGEPLPLLDRYAQYVLSSSGRSHPVASLLPNAEGLFDMHGNVWEWVQDTFSTSLSVSPVRTDTRRVLRGGGFSDLPLNVHSAVRSRNSLNSRADSYGMRVAKTYP